MLDISLPYPLQGGEMLDGSPDIAHGVHGDDSPALSTEHLNKDVPWLELRIGAPPDVRLADLSLLLLHLCSFGRRVEVDES